MTRLPAIRLPAADSAIAGWRPKEGRAEAVPAPARARRRPRAVAFDVIGTLFDPSPLDGALADLGLPQDSSKVWFARILRDAFALEIVGEFRPFSEVASASLRALAEGGGLKPSDQAIAGIIESFATLPAHPEVRAGCEALRAAGVRMLALTNGNADVTREMLARGGLDVFMERSLSIDEVKHWKPARAVYLHAAKAMEVEPREMALIAAHDWDTAGASRAGLITGGVMRGSAFSAALPPPDFLSRSLSEVVEQLLALPA